MNTELKASQEKGDASRATSSELPAYMTTAANAMKRDAGDERWSSSNYHLASKVKRVEDEAITQMADDRGHKKPMSLMSIDSSGFKQSKQKDVQER